MLGWTGVKFSSSFTSVKHPVHPHTWIDVNPTMFKQRLKELELGIIAHCYLRNRRKNEISGLFGAHRIS